MQNNVSLWICEATKLETQVIAGENGDKYVGGVIELNGKTIRHGQVISGLFFSNLSSG